MSKITPRYNISEWLIKGDIEEGGAGEMNSTPSAKDVYLHLDIHKVDQVVRNLITNAVITFATGVLSFFKFLFSSFLCRSSSLLRMEQ